jgi:tetratricopeptide (TPR) repeat protein
MDGYTDEYKGYRNIIKSIYNEKDYSRCLEECCKFLEVLNTNDNLSRDKWFCNLRISKCYYNLRQYKKATNYAHKSQENFYLETDNIGSIWMLTLCYEGLGDIEKAIKYCNFCIKYYKTKQLYKELYDTLQVKANIMQNERLLTNVIKLYKKLDGEVSIDEFDNAYSNLFDIYLHKNNLQKCWSILPNIHNNCIKKQLNSKMLQCAFI